MSQISNLSFSVRFEAHNPNKVILTDTTPVLPAGYVGIFKVIQPDGYVREGNINTPDVNTVTRVAEIALIPDSKGQIQKGQYVIELTALAPGYLSTTFTRTFAFQYTPATVKLRNDFDLFTPKLQYTDITNYAVSDYNLTSGPTRSWNVTSPTTGAITGTAATIDLKKNDKYYAENYAIGFSVSLVYANQSLSWLTVAHNQSASETVNACVPKPLDELTQSIDALRVESNEACGGDWDKFEKASTLYSHLFSMLRLVLVDEQFQPGFYDVYQQLLSLLNNGQTFCNSIGNEILPYDFINYESSVSVGLASETDGVVITDTPVTTVGVLKINIDTASAEGPGLLSDEDWMIFNAKQDFITPGTTAQYWRGDKTWQTLNTSVVPEGTNLYFTNTRARQAVSLTTNGNSGASTYDNATGVFNIPNYTLAGLGGVPSARVLTINGLAQDLSADRTWNVGTVTSISTTGPITGGPITGSGTIGITQSGASSDGYLSSTDWNVFNSKEPYIAPGTTAQYWRGDKTWQTLNTAVVPESTNLYYTDARARLAISLTTNGNSGPSTYNNTTGVLNVPNYTLAGLGGVPLTRSLTINGTTYDLSGDRTWNVGTVTGSGTLNYVAKWTPDGTALGNSQIFDNGTNVGIGTVSPSFSLDVQTASARVRVKPSTSTNYALFQAENAGNIAYLGIDNSAGALSGTAYALNVYHNGAYPIVFSTSGVNRMWVSSVGNVGVGTASPSSKLQVVGGVTAQSALLSHAMPNGDVIAWFDNNNTTTDQSFGLLIDAGTSANDYALRVRNAATTELFRITGAGNVGIGTAIPSQSLHVVGRQRIDTPSANTSSITPSLISDSAITISATGNDNITGNLTAGISFGEPAGRYAAIYGYDDGASQSQGLLFITGNNSSVSGRLKIASTGSITATSLAGTGTRMVVADANGVLSTQSLGSGAVTGTGTLNYVAKWTPNGATLGDSSIFDDGSRIGISRSNPSYKVDLLTSTDGFDGFNVNNNNAGVNAISGYRAINGNGIGLIMGVTEFSASSALGGANQAVIYNVGSQALIFGTSSIERMRIFNNGRVGINTGATDQGSALQVVGSLYNSASAVLAASSGNVFIGATTAAISTGLKYAYIEGGIAGIGPEVVLHNTVAQDTAEMAISFTGVRSGAGVASQIKSTRRGILTFHTQDLPSATPSTPAERMRVASDGNVAIGTTNTGYGKLGVYDATNSLLGVANSTSYAQLQQNGADLYINTNLSGAAGGNLIFRFGSGVTERMRVYSTGNVFIGSSPVDNGYRLDVSGNLSVRTGKIDVIANTEFAMNLNRADVTPVAFQAFNSGSNGWIIMGAESSSGGGLFTGSSAYASVVGSASNRPLQFATNSIVRMTVSNSGNVGIGVTPSPWSGVSASLQLGVSPFIASTGQYLFVSSNSYYNGTNAIYTSNGASAQYSQYEGSHMWYTASSGTAGNVVTLNERLRISSTGSITASSLAGTGTRMVVADANGVLSTQSLGSGSVAGSGTLNYVAKWTPDGATLGNSQIFDNGTNVGIGTTTPGARLDVSGGQTLTANFNFSGNGTYVRWQNNGTSFGDIGSGATLVSGGSVNDFAIHARSGNNIVFSTNFSEKMRIFANGRVGIGTNSTDYGHALQVIGNIYSNSNLIVDGNYRSNTGATALTASTGLNYIGKGDNTRFSGFNFQGVAASDMFFGRTANSDDLVISTSNTGSPAERVRFTQSGNVGIGVTPSAWTWRALQVGTTAVASTSTVGFLSANAYFDGAYKYTTTGSAQVLEVNNGNEFRFLTAGSGTAGSAVTFTQAMTVFSNGNVSVGNSTNAGYKFDVFGGNARVYGSGLFVEQGSGFQTAIALNQVGVRQWVIRNVATSALFAINDGSFDRLVINGSTGNVGIGTTSPDYALEVERAGVSDIVSNSTVDSNSAIVSTYNSSATSLNFMQMRSYGNATGTTLFGTSTNKMNALFSNADSSMAMGTISATPVIFGTSNAHRMRITPDGYVLINRTSSVAADYFLQINGQTYGESTVAFKQTGNLAAYFLNTISVPNAATFNGGTAWSGVRSINDMTFNGSVTIPDAAVVGGAVNANRISFATASNTITMTQTGNSVRAIAGFQILNQFAGANSGTISHGAGILVQGVDRVGGGSTLTFTNYYGIAINDMNEFGEASFTNRWGVYQAGTTDKNYFAARTLIGSNVDGGGGQILQVTGNALITGTVRTGAPAGGTSGAWKLGSYVSSTTTFDTTGYLEVEVDGGTYMIALSAGNPT